VKSASAPEGYPRETWLYVCVGLYLGHSFESRAGRVCGDAYIRYYGTAFALIVKGDRAAADTARVLLVRALRLPARKA